MAVTLFTEPDPDFNGYIITIVWKTDLALQFK